MSKETKTDTNKKRMLDALEKALGIVTQACKIAELSRSQHYKWLEEDEQYKFEVESIGDMALDFAESKLHKNIAKGKETSIIFYLKTKGKKRGFVERIQHEDLNPPQPFDIVVYDSKSYEDKKEE